MHKPNDISRQIVKKMASCGLRQTDIAKYLSITDKTLRKHYPDELQTAKVDKMIKLVEHAYSRAFENDTVLMFLLKTYCGFRETGPMEGEQDVNPQPLEIKFDVLPAKDDVKIKKGK